jgi:hypothetical protein
LALFLSEIGVASDVAAVEDAMGKGGSNDGSIHRKSPSSFGKLVFFSSNMSASSVAVVVRVVAGVSTSDAATRFCCA